MSLIINNFSVKINHLTNLINNLDISLNENEILVIQGKSGSGKSTILRSIAGFIDVSSDPKMKKKTDQKRNWFNNDNKNIFCSGQIYFNDKIINNLDPRERSLGFLMQNSKIYPHLDSPEKILKFPYKINKTLKNKISEEDYDKKAQEVFDKLKFTIPYNEKFDNLSGGEEQRLLLAKYILLSPTILLLDEPFSNLDYFQREVLRNMIRDILIDKNNSIKYILMVSHDINDCKIADKILLLIDEKCHMIKKNQFETAFNIFSRLYGDWTDNESKIVKNNIISHIISKPGHKNMVKSIFSNFFDTLSIKEGQRKSVFEILKNEYNSDIEVEAAIKEIIYPIDKSIYMNALKDRSNIIFDEVNEYLFGESILDIGCGDGLVADKIRKETKGFKIELTDIYKHELISELKFPFKLMPNEEIVPYESKSCDTSLLLTVLHHSTYPLEILKEAIRVTRKRIIIIESILGISKSNPGIMTDYVNQRLSYARLVDWTYNRIVYDDINVPYNFHCVEDWIKIFEEHNLKLSHGQDLGVDIKVVPEHHYLFVLDLEQSTENNAYN